MSIQLFLALILIVLGVEVVLFSDAQPLGGLSSWKPVRAVRFGIGELGFDHALKLVLVAFEYFGLLRSELILSDLPMEFFDLLLALEYLVWSHIS